MFTKPKRKVDRVFVHCSASDNPAHDDVSIMDQWHRARGWNEVGYHFFIKKDGRVQRGRSLEKVPAAQAGHNIGTIAICCHGLKDELFTDEQMDSLYDLCSKINSAYNEHITFHGHCEVSSKTCPVFDYKSVLNLDSKGYMK